MKALYHPSVIAFLILVVVCAIGVYTIRSARWQKPVDEYFATEQPQPMSPSQQEKPNLQAPEYASLVASALQTPPKTEPECKANYEFCITGGGLLKDCWSKYKVCLASVPKVVEPKTQQIQQSQQSQPQRNANPMNVPTQGNLQTIQEGSTAIPVLTLEEIKAKYLPLAQKLKPHEQPMAKPSPLTSHVQTDKGTLAEKIQQESRLAPSLRDMIRKDVSDVVRQELEGAQYDNPYEVRYT